MSHFREVRSPTTTSRVRGILYNVIVYIFLSSLILNYSTIYKSNTKAFLVMTPPTPTPLFSSLPLQKDGPRGNAWGLFGKNDELGMLHRLTPETTLAATKEIVHGIRISTDWELNKPNAPCFGRQRFHQHIKHKAPRTVNDDILTLNTQSSSQWDGFRHFGM